MKGDGLCLYRSLYQLFNLYNGNMDKKQKHHSQINRIITADVDLTNIIVEAVVIAVVRSAVKIVAVDRSEVVAVAAALEVVSYLKLFCPLSSL